MNALNSLRDRISEWLDSQVWFQQIKQKWDELDSQVQQIVKLAAAGAGILFCVVILGIWSLSVRSLKNEISEKRVLLTQMRGAQQEMRALREVNQGALGGMGGTWSHYAQQQLTQLGIAAENINVGVESPWDSSEIAADLAKRYLIEITLKKINVRQLVKAAFAIENGSRPGRLKKIVVDTEPDLSGYLSATLLVSAYQPAGEQ